MDERKTISIGHGSLSFDHLFSSAVGIDDDVQEYDSMNLNDPKVPERKRSRSRCSDEASKKHLIDTNSDDMDTSTDTTTSTTHDTNSNV